MFIRLLIAITCVAVAAACEGSEQIVPGTPEESVRKTLGEPSLILTEHRWIEDYLFKSDLRTTCAPKAARALYYRRFWRKSVTVALDMNGRVVCIQQAFELTQ